MSTKQSPQLARILGTIAEGNHYEAHQQCISVYQRYVRQKRIKMAKGLLYEASMALLKADAMGSGIDLANCFAKLLDEQTALPLDEATASELMRLFDLMDLEHAQVAFFMKYCKKYAFIYISLQPMEDVELDSPFKRFIGSPSGERRARKRTRNGRIILVHVTSKVMTNVYIVGVERHTMSQE